MSSFKVLRHVIDGQHIRHNLGGFASDTEPVKLEVKQYVPLSNPDPKPGDVTVIATHAAGFTKELYEPMFAALLDRSATGFEHPSQPGKTKPRFRIRGIWMADLYNMGYSGLLNSERLGNAPNYLDHTRDLLCMVNTFRSQMPPPLVGLGHSMGTTQMAMLSFVHPSLFAAVALVESIISDLPTPGYERVRDAVLSKRDHWPTRGEAEASVRRSRFYGEWDPRVVDLLCEHGFQRTPNVVYPDRKGWTLLTSRHQEGFISMPKGGYAQEETVEAFRALPFIKPPLLFLQGDRSRLTNKEARRRRLQVAGTGLSVGGGVDGTGADGGGNGGVSTGGTREAEIRGGHFLPFENVEGTAEAVAIFFDEHIAAWNKRYDDWYSEWSRKTARERQVLPEDQDLPGRRGQRVGDVQQGFKSSL